MLMLVIDGFVLSVTISLLLYLMHVLQILLNNEESLMKKLTSYYEA